MQSFSPRIYYMSWDKFAYKNGRRATRGDRDTVLSCRSLTHWIRVDSFVERWSSDDQTLRWLDSETSTSSMLWVVLGCRRGRKQRQGFGAGSEGSAVDASQMLSSVTVSQAGQNFKDTWCLHKVFVLRKKTIESVLTFLIQENSPGMCAHCIQKLLSMLKGLSYWGAFQFCLFYCPRWEKHKSLYTFAEQFGFQKLMLCMLLIIDSTCKEIKGFCLIVTQSGFKLCALW